MKLSDKVTGKNINFKNRIVMPPMATAKADNVTGNVTDEIIDYYNEKTKSGLFSAVIVEHNYVDLTGKAHKFQMSASKDSNIEGLRRLAETINNNGSESILQISHGGSLSNSEITGVRPVAPSEILNPTGKGKELPKELTLTEIEEIVNLFADAAERGKKAGFKGVEIHSAHGYLLDQFLSPLSNKRNDEYGGDIFRRIRIHKEIIREIRKRVGEDYPIFIRMGAGDFMEGGLNIEDAVIAAKEFERMGIDVIDISGGMCFYSIEDKTPGYFSSVSKPIFLNVSVPVILTGGIKTGDEAEKVLSFNASNLLGIGRAVYKDSNWIERELSERINK